MDPLEPPHVVSRVPLVEKTVPGHREDGTQWNTQAARLERDRVHQDEHVRMERQDPRAEPETDVNRQDRQAVDKKPAKRVPAPEKGGIEWVEEAEDALPHTFEAEA